MEPTLRPFEPADTDGVVAPALRAWGAVDPSAQRAGIGRAFTEHGLDQLRAAGCRLAMAATGGDPGHAPARRLYGSAGFTCLPLVNYYRLL
jgi:GNAT superfamily N-acetyltransferase